MSEMALTADHLIVIGRGRLIRDLSLADFIADASASWVRVHSPQASELRDLLLGPDVTVTSTQHGMLRVQGLTAQEIGTRAASNGLTLYELSLVQASLEEAYMQITKDAVEYQGVDSDQPATDLRIAA
jgi:ABC-2 type transport system ATP-binding protein